MTGAMTSGMRAGVGGVFLWGLMGGVGCAQRPVRPAGPGSIEQMPARAALLAGGRRGPRLGWVAWGADGALIACGGRAPSAAALGAGTPERCVRVDGVGGVGRVGRAGAAPREVAPEELAAGRRDTTPAEWAPGGCRVLLEDSKGSGPARASLIGPRERVLLGEWQPGPEVGGDVYSLETSFSADGRQLALLQWSVGVGDDGLLVELKGAEVRAAPACR